MTVTYLQIMQAVASLISSLLAGTALLYSMTAYTRTLKTSHYNELDKNYLTLLNVALATPYLIEPGTITTKEQQEKYNIYAFMVWNFLEAIFDKSLTDKHLKETWIPIIEVEGQIHYNWFKREENKSKFKDRFYTYVVSLLDKQQTK